MKKLAILASAFILLTAFSTDKKNKNKAEEPKKEDIIAYRVFDKTGKEVRFTDAAEKLLENNVIFFGELHNNPIAHWFQLKLTALAHAKMKDKLMLGAEMFEADNQMIMDEFLGGNISEKSFEDEIRLWPNYATDYKPLVAFAKQNNLKFICTNIPRRYANMVYKGGIEALMKLSDDAKKFIAPLPFEYDGEVGCYKKMKEMSGGHGGDNLPKAQASKDATMAHFISKNMSADKMFIHYNGSYHSDNNEGIQWYLNKYNPSLKRASITTVMQKDPSVLEKENQDLADFIIVVADDMTSTH